MRESKYGGKGAGRKHLGDNTSGDNTSGYRRKRVADTIGVIFLALCLCCLLAIIIRLVMLIHPASSGDLNAEATVSAYNSSSSELPLPTLAEIEAMGSQVFAQPAQSVQPTNIASDGANLSAEADVFQPIPDEQVTPAQPEISDAPLTLTELAELYGASEEVQQYLNKGESADKLLSNLRRYDESYKKFAESGRLDGLGKYEATAEELASWESVGTFKVVGYNIWDGEQCGWNVPTGLASSHNNDPVDDAAVPGLTCAANKSVLKPGTVLYIEGYGKVYVNDTGVSGKVVDMAFDNNADCYALTGKYAVYVVSRPE